MRRWWVVLSLSAAALAPVLLAQMRSSVTRERGEFVQTTTGSISVPDVPRFRVTSDGAVVVRGSDQAGISYTIRQHTKASSDADARARLRNVIVRNTTRGGWNHLTVAMGDPTIITSEIYLNVPKRWQQVAISSIGGNVEAYDLDGVVEAVTSGGRVQMDRIGSHAVAKTSGSDIRIGRVRGTLKCFSGGGSIQVDSAGGETWCETAGGNIVIGEVGGVLHATTAGGNIRVRRAAASVVSRSDGGLIEIGGAGGVVTAQTRGGSIEVGSSQGATCESAAGAIRVRGMNGPLRAQTALGSILAELAPAVWLDESSLNSGAGDITVFIPSNVAVSVHALSESKNRTPRIVSDFPEIRVRPATGARTGRLMAEGALNGGGPVLRITAASGNIYLRRR